RRNRVYVRHGRAKVADCFFFSSRRRHTRWPRDWSSDVCSSDLKQASKRAPARQGRNPPPLPVHSKPGESPAEHPPPTDEAAPGRSEERRVGKEWKVGGARGL